MEKYINDSRIGILFGAGAEKIFGMPLGAEFAKETYTFVTTLER